MRRALHQLAARIDAGKLCICLEKLSILQLGRDGKGGLQNLYSTLQFWVFPCLTASVLNRELTSK